jgi:starvation-inducible DNA-binding protein
MIRWNQEQIWTAVSYLGLILGVNRGLTMESKSAKKTEPQLATPTDLDPVAVTTVAKALNVILADSFALYLKTKNFHWHVSGPNFRDYHIMLDEQAEQIFAATDPLAERIRKLGGKTLRSISHITQTQSLKDNNDEFVTPNGMLLELLADNKKVAAAMRRAHELCDDHKDVATASLLEVYIDETERRTWFLFEASRPPDDSGH